MIEGADISRYNAGWTVEDDLDFVIVKASEAKKATNTEFDRQAKMVRDSGVVVGFYHWLHVDDFPGQAKFFVDKVKPRAGELLVCDWEQAGVTDKMKDQFIAEVQKLAPHNLVGLYCNPSWWKPSNKKRGDFLWIANYNVDKPRIDEPWDLWQYTEEPMDYNRARFNTRAEMQTWAQSKEPKPEKPGGAYRVIAKDGLNGRKSPSTKAESVVVRKPGDVINVHSWVTGDGRLWGATATPTYYAADYLEKVKTTLYRTTEPLNGRAGPGTSFAIVTDEPRPVGFPIEAERIVKGGGREWAVTPYGTHYALEYLKKEN